MIAQLLDPPDAERPNPFYRTSAPMRFYSRERVERVESEAEFARLRDLARRRSESARAAASRRRDALLERIRAVEVAVPSLTPDRLRLAAVAHRNRREFERCYLLPGMDGSEASADAVDAATLRRWEVNYLRHELTGYDSLLADVEGRVGREAAERLIRTKVYAAIAAKYPLLRDECRRQLEARGVADDYVRAS